MRLIAAVILGALVGSAILLVVGMISNAINPTPPELMDPATAEAVAERVAATPTSKWLMVILGLALGSFGGAVIAVAVARRKALWVSSSVGLLLSLWAFYALYVVYPAELWFPACGLVSIALFSYLGGISIRRRLNNRAP